MLSEKARRRWVTVGVMVGMFLAAMEVTVVATAMPTIVAHLGGLAVYSWVFSAYLLTSTVTVPLWGKLSDLYGRRPLYLIGVGVFLLGSTLCGLAQGMGELIAFRALQGLGAGALLPIGLTIVGDAYDLDGRARVQGLFSGVWGAASIVGPFLGGFLTDHLSWRWVFFVNLPVGAVTATIIAMRLIDPLRPPTRRPGIDYLGAAALGAAIICLLFGLWARGSVFVFHPVVWWLLAAGFLSAFIWVEQRAPEPIVPLELFRDRVFSVACSTGLLAGMAMFGAISFIPLFVQAVIGTDATAAGAVLTPFMLAWCVGSVTGAPLLPRIGVRPILLTGVVALNVGFFLFTRLGMSTTRPEVMVDMAIAGLGMGLIMAPLMIAVQNSVPRLHLGVATSVAMFSRTIGGAIGVAVLGGVVGERVAQGVAAVGVENPQVVLILREPGALWLPGAGSGLTVEAIGLFRAVLADALHAAFVAAAVMALIAMASAYFFPDGRPQPARVPREGSIP